MRKAGKAGVLAFLLVCLGLTPLAAQDKSVVARAIEELEGGKGDKFAVIVGIDDYSTVGIADLKFAANDAKEFYRILTDPEHGAFAEADVKLMTPDADDPDDRPTKNNILARVKSWLGQAQDGDTILFYFSGHGIEENDQSYLITTDSKLSLLSDTTVPSRRVLELMAETKASKRVLILDSCYSGAKGAEEMGKATADVLSESKGWVKLASCREGQRSYQRKDVPYSVFTYAVLQGLGGVADDNQDGLITSGELNLFAWKEVRRWAAENSKEQEPVYSAVISGEIVLSLAGGSFPSAGPSPPAQTSVAKGKIAFVSERDGNPEIYAMDADGTTETRLTNNLAGDQGPSWSPDGSRIAFTSYRDGNWEVYVMNCDGTNQTRLTNSPADEDLPAWSPDGTKIAFGSRPGGNWQVYLMNPDGTGQINLSNNSWADWRPAWSPDGSKIAFISERDGNREIYAMNSDGTNQVNLTKNPSDDWWPAWSPDGTRIAFSSDRDGNREIHVMNPDGTGQTRITSGPGKSDVPSWFPDGTRIAFQSERDGNYEIYVMNSDGTNQTRLISDPAWDDDPSWSPF